jgi:hypothetical protein
MPNPYWAGCLAQAKAVQDMTGDPHSDIVNEKEPK